MVVAGLSGCWPVPGDDWQDDRGEAIVRSRAVEGDLFVKLKEGLARSLYESLDGEERCVDTLHCRRRGEQIICSAENLRDPYVCEVRLVDGEWVAPREDWELYHSLEANREFGTAMLAEGQLTLSGDAAAALSQRWGSDELSLSMPDGRVGP